jgi:hypothetical protein
MQGRGRALRRGSVAFLVAMSCALLPAMGAAQGRGRNGPVLAPGVRPRGWTHTGLVASCGGTWSVDSSPSPGEPHNYLFGVAGISKVDAWAVGDTQDAAGVLYTLTQHWDGAAWTVVASPNPSPYLSYIQSVAAIASDDVWAVGQYQTTMNGYQQTLALHWDGSSWTVVPTPNPDPYFDALYGVSAVASDDVWAVGSVNSGHATLIEHWNGTAWTVVYSPNPGNPNTLYSVSANASNDVWAVGGYGPPGGGPGSTLIEHWDGTEWTAVEHPDPPVKVNGNYLYNVSAISTEDVWAVGTGQDPQTGFWIGITEHWDGAAWNVVQAQNPGQNDELKGVYGTSSDDVWAVGWSKPFNSSYDGTLIEHWDGSAWTVVSSPNQSTYENRLWSVFAFPRGDAWAVGDWTDNPSGMYFAKYTLIERLREPPRPASQC